MNLPAPNWTDLLTAVVSAAVGWLAAWLRMWQPPRPPGGES